MILSPYIYIDTNARVVRVKRGIAERKFLIDDLDEVSITPSNFRLSKFILKNGDVIPFDSNNLAADDVSFLESLVEGRDKE